MAPLISILALACLMTTTLSAATPVIVAHRGESHLAPENTLPAYELAWKLGVDAAECDIQLTADGKLILCHDKDTKRTTGQTLPVKDSTLAQLRALDAGAWKAPEFAGTKMPTIEELLAIVPAGRRLFIEVKCGPEAIAPLAKALEPHKAHRDRFLIICFKAEVLLEARRLLPQHQTYFLASFKQDEKTKAWAPDVDTLIQKARDAKANGISVQAKPFVDAAFIAKIKAAGFSSHVWTVNKPDEAARFAAYGIDSITTDRAAWLRDQLSSPR